MIFVPRPRLILPRRDLIVPQRSKQGGFIVNPYAFGAGGAGAGYLDSITGVRAVYGLRRMVSTSTLALRVKNLTTSTQYDIGWSGNAISSTDIAASFTGGQSVGITKIYNQMGNSSYDFVQTTDARMPRIVSAGVYAGTIRFTTSEYLETSSALPFGTPQWGIFTRHDFNALSTRVFIEMSLNASGSNTQAAFLYAPATNKMNMYCQNGAGAARHTQSDCFTSKIQRTWLFDRSIVGAGEFVYRQAGSVMSQSNSATTEQTGNFSSYKVYLGARGDATLFAAMDLDNLVLTDGDVTADLTYIEGIVGTAP